MYEIVIVGGGPVGLALAADLGHRGRSCLLLEQGNGVVAHPKLTLVNVRSMEFCRRWGIVDEMRKVGFARDFPRDIVYTTGLNGHEITRFHYPTYNQREPHPDYVEHNQYCSQMWFEPILLRLARSFDGVELRHHTRLDSLQQDGDGVTLGLTNLRTGGRQQVRAGLVVGCDGAGSTTRKLLGINFEGNTAASKSINIIFRCPDLWRYHAMGKAAHTWTIRPDGPPRVLISVNGSDLWRLMVGFEGNEDLVQQNPAEFVYQMLGIRFPLEVVSVLNWLRHRRIASSYRSGRVFLAGDAAHALPPTGGYGMNLGLGDIMDLSWKLDAQLAGWGGEDLLSSYQQERRPEGQRIINEATSNMALISQIPRFRDILEDGVDGVRGRGELGDFIQKHNRKQYASEGVQLGVCYANSPIIVGEAGPPPTQAPDHYRPTTYPGCRAPHAWLAPGRSMLDLFGTGMQLCYMGDHPGESAPLQEAASRRKLPLGFNHITDPQIRKCYQRRWVLVRPDGHVAWRGDKPPRDPEALLDKVRGTGSQAHHS